MAHQLIPNIAIPRNNDKIRLTFLSFLSFAAGLPSSYSLELVGQIFLAEILIIPLALILFFFGKSRIGKVKLFHAFAITGIIMIIGYILSDLVAGTESSKYLRAWGRNLFLLTDLIALAVIAGTDRRLIWWFVLGVALGTISQLALANIPISDWKLGYGRQFILMVLFLGYFLPYRVTMLGLVALAVVSVYLDSRSLGGFCLLIAGIIFLRVKNPNGLKISPSAIFRIIIASTLVTTLLITLMIQTQDEFSNRRTSSSAGRFAAIRIGLIAISDSPIIGHGSWGEGTKKYADMLYNELSFEMMELDRSNVWQRAQIFRPHSQILQAWIEGGLLAAIFFIFFGYQLFIGIKNIILTRKLDRFTALYTFLLLQSAWHLIMSPYAGHHRLMIALSIAILCSLKLERSNQ